MDISLRFTVLFAISILAMLCNPRVTAIEGLEASFTPSTTATTPSTPQELQEHSFFSHTALLPPILSHLGFHELATAAPSLSDSAATAASAWTGLFTIDYMRRGTKIETLSPGRCIPLTSDSVNRKTSTTASAKVFIGGVEITQPDLFNNGMVVIHGLQGFISPLSPFYCDVERMTSLSFPFHPDHHSGQHIKTSGSVQPAIMRLMLRDAMLRLRNNGFSILALAMKVKYAELVTLNNTI
ncbi:hypothetical protein MtrunA17_Chr3g0094921 [Medicago truncatula]|uniref:Transmembrane protein n=1 Tax=Medicago truncatula TaxID=3880 RepID=A0A396IM28_MEDTR|nr:hypothetical protein MtrunA17_Chr3g0094921 [Medicago truncatula]